jgi:3-phytase
MRLSNTLTPIPFNRLVAAVFLICAYAISALSQSEPLRPVTATIDGRNVDSMAFWIAPKKAESLLLLTEKAGNEVMVFRTNRQAQFVRRFGEFKRPNAIVVVRDVRFGKRKMDLAFITERDANKVSVYSVPSFEKVGEFAQDVPQPMGISIYRGKSGLQAFVVAKRAEGNDKVIRFRITEQNGSIGGVREITFGSELTPNQETVFVDSKTRMVYVADETAKNIKIYDLDGKLRKTIGDGIFQAQVEGIALAECGKRRLLIATDQLDITEFEIFDLNGHRHLGTVVTTASRTDGIALTQTRLPDFPNGLFVAQTDPDDTGGLRAEFYDLGEFFKRANIVCK